MTKLVRYLAREGVQLEVLTAPAGPHHPIDALRLKEVEGLVVIHQAEAPPALTRALAWLHRDRFRGALRLYHLIDRTRLSRPAVLVVSGCLEVGS